MSIATIIARVLLGGVFLFFGLNYWTQLVQPPPMPEQGGQFMGILFGSGYLAIVKVIEIVGGALTLASIGLKRYAPLGVSLLTPVAVNILIFHALLAPEGVPMAAVLVLLCAFLVYAYRENFKGIFAA